MLTLLKMNRMFALSQIQTRNVTTVIPDLASPLPDPIDSPPVDIGGFHNLMDRASARFALKVSTEQTMFFV